MELILAASLAVAAVLAWTAWETTMASRLRRDRRPLPARNAAVAGAHRLTAMGQLGLIAVAVVVAALASVSLWWSPVAVAPVTAGVTVTALLVAGAGVAAGWTARRHPSRQDRRALLAVAVTAVATEVLLRGLGLGLLDAAGWPVTVAVLVAAVLTGALQGWRASRGSRGYAFVLSTVLGFVLGLVVVLTGSVLAAAAIHVGVASLSLARALAAAGQGQGCQCGGHDHETTGGSTTGVPAVAAAVTGATPCGTACDHAGSSACAVCPLSAARV